MIHRHITTSFAKLYILLYYQQMHNFVIYNVLKSIIPDIESCRTSINTATQSLK